MRGLGLKGHRRVINPIGLKQGRQRPPAGGYHLSCLCGWDGGVHPIRRVCQEAYSDHILKLLKESKFQCKRCRASKPLNEMRTDYRYICLRCSSELGNEWQKRNPTASSEHKRKHHLATKFGLTLDEFNTLLVGQGGVCAICKRDIRDPRGYSPHVDHDHSSGTVRGILCMNCNQGIGQFRDNTDLLKAAIAYLESHHAQEIETHK